MIHPVAQWALLVSFDNGVFPSVAITDDGLIVEVHAGPPDGESVFSRFASFPSDIATVPVAWPPVTQAASGPVQSVSVDASRAGVVAIYTDLGKNLYRITAPIPASGEQALSWSAPQSFDAGISSDVAMNNNGNILFVHDTSKAFEAGDLFFGWGTFSGGMSTGLPLQGLTGWSPKVAMNNGGQVIIAFMDNDSILNLMAATFDASQSVPLINCGVPVTSVEANGNNSFDVAIDDSNNFVVALNGGWITGTISNNVPYFTSPFSFPGRIGANSVALNSASQAYYECNESTGTSNQVEEFAFSGCVGCVANGAYSNWMQQLVASDAGVGNIPISLLALPGSHDSGTYAIAGNVFNLSFDDPWYYGIEAGLMADWAIAQTLSIYDQLSYGVRYLDLRVIQDGGTFYTCHGLFGASMQQVLTDIQRFCAGVSSEILIMDMNHLFDYQFGGSVTMSDASATALCNYVLQTLGDLVLDPSFFNLSLTEIWQMRGFLNGGRVFVFTTSTVQTSFASRIGLSCQPPPPPSSSATLASYWPSVDSLPALEQQLSSPSFVPAQQAVWSQYLSTRDASRILFNVTQCIATPGSSQVFGGGTLIQWESQICSPGLYWLFSPAIGYATCLNIVLVDEVPQTIITPSCIVANRAKAAAFVT